MNPSYIHHPTTPSLSLWSILKSQYFVSSLLLRSPIPSILWTGKGKETYWNNPLCVYIVTGVIPSCLFSWWTPKVLGVKRFPLKLRLRNKWCDQIYDLETIVPGTQKHEGSQIERSGVENKVKNRKRWWWRQGRGIVRQLDYLTSHISTNTCFMKVINVKNTNEGRHERLLK